MLEVARSDQRRRRTAWVTVAVLVAAVLLGVVDRAGVARADVTTVSQDTLRTGWDRAEPTLSPAAVAASDFGRLFSTPLDGQIYAQPIVAANTLLAVTENDRAYGLDPVSGAVRWTRDVGPAWPAGAIGCGDLVPNIGITGTPVFDPTSRTAYFTAKVDDGPDQGHPHWYMHAVDITTGAERAGFPTTITGAPSNDPANQFNPFTAMQRPGLLLMNGVVYAGFASHCDAGPYVGYVVGVDAAHGGLTTMWSTEAGSSNALAGIWQSGGGLVSDGDGRIIVATGNGVSPAPGPGSSPPSTLAESVIRLQVGADGNLSAADFFSPTDNTNLDRDDTDLGSGGPLAIPDGYGTAAHPHLLVEVGKDGRVFLLDRDHLGGTGQGPDGGDDVLQTAGPFNGVWGHPAFWGGDTGYVYTVENGGPLRAFALGATGDGRPALTSVGTSAASWGYTSGSPVVTSVGTDAGSALVWSVYSTGSNGAGGQLRAYDAVPTDGVLRLRFSAPIGTASKFQVAATSGGRVYVGSRDGKLFGFGRPSAGAITGTSTDFGAVRVGTTGQATATVTATTPVTITAVTTSAPFSATPPTLPVKLLTGQRLAVPVTFSPTAPGAASTALTFRTKQGEFAFDLHGSGIQPGLGATPSALAFGEVPVGGRATLSARITNTGDSTETITGATAAGGDFTATGLPATGTQLAPGASVSVPVGFAPRTTGAVSNAFSVASDRGSVTVPLTGTGVSGASHLTITPTTLAFGSVAIGSSRSKSFTLTNTGNLTLTISKAAPPAAPFITEDPVSEGQQLAPGDSITQVVSFTPTSLKTSSGGYIITSDDGQGAQTVTVTGTATRTPLPVPGPATGTWHANGVATQSGTDTVLTPADPDAAGSVVSPRSWDTAKLHVTFTAEIDGGNGADGLSFALLDAATSSPTTLGGTGGALGFAGSTGVAVTLDTFQNDGDVSDNLVGIARSGPDTAADVVTYLAQRSLPTSLRQGTHTVDVTVGANRITAVVDGKVTVTAEVPVPTRAFLAFTAGTGGLTDVHTVRDVIITRPTPSGTIVSATGPCLTTTVKDGVVLAGCGTTSRQQWVVTADGSLAHAGRCLQPLAAVVGGGVAVAGCDGTAQQRWTTRSDGTLQQPASKLCLRALAATTTPHTEVSLGSCDPRYASRRWTAPH